jgi:cytochrome b subunit of formate dehydrogenase
MRASDRVRDQYRTRNIRQSCRAALALIVMALFSFAAPDAWAALALKSSDCLDCHQDASLTKDLNGKPVSVSVDPKKFSASVHGVLECGDCHGDVKAYPHEPAPARVVCKTCHAEAQAGYNSGVHAKALAAGRNGARCFDCHGSPHEILPGSDPNARTYRTNLPIMCGTCHGQKFVMEKSGLSNQPFVSYEESVHGRAVSKGSLKAAICTDCHGIHEILPAGDSKSSIFKFNVSKTCGQCHSAIATEYLTSVHGKAILRGNWQAPVCTDCHGIHMIKSHVDPTSSVAAQNVGRTTCSQCHAGVKLTQEFNVPSQRVSSYQQSYHGLARQLGSKVAANCASCHGVHNIFPSSDPRSTINRKNLARTCGKCHAGATQNFAKGKIHLDGQPSDEIGSTIVGWVRLFYITVIWMTIGSMMLHNLLIWWRKAQAARRAKDRIVQRMNTNQRIQHVLLLVSFIVLALTGFALKYPESAFAWMFGSSEEIRRTIHRIAAVVMLGAGLYHVFYMIFTAEGRRGLRDFWFRLKDARDVVDTLRYYLGFSNVKPKMGRFTYGEKAEYWAVIWGTIVMGLTGLMIWYNVITARWMPRWWIDVATAVHFYEAVLACLAIIVWHFYHVIFDPDVYPITWTWYDGKMSLHHFEEEHGELYEEWLRARRNTEPPKAGDDDRGA